jgi:hypothetical protein
MKTPSFAAHVVMSRARIRNHPGHSSQKSHGRKGGDPADLHDDAAIRETFGYHDAKTGLTAEVQSIRSSGPQFSTYVDIAIRDGDGKQIGQIVRTVRPAGEKEVRADGMALRPGHQGQGFASRYNAKTEDAYRSYGIERVTTNANIDVGGYSNARGGYDFATSDARSTVARAATSARSRFDGNVQREIDRVATNPKASPIDFAMIGHTPGATMWPGKEIMLGSNWEGVKIL